MQIYQLDILVVVQEKKNGATEVATPIWCSINILLIQYTLKIQMGEKMVHLAIFIKVGIINEALVIPEPIYT